MPRTAKTPPIAIPHLNADRLAALKDLVPEAFVEDQIDFDKLRAALGEQVDESPERYTFSWAGKRDALRMLQAPTRATLVPAPGESLDFDTTGNIFIEGDNLEALKLLYRPYFGRVMLIYIDPPYNTGNDFIYPDDYRDPLGRYLELTGQQDAEGNLLTSNPETSGRYHSAWLSMMYPRLFLARQLLREDGVIFVSIDDHEMHNLRMLMNEVFGEENFVACICWEKADSPRMDAEHFSTRHDYVVVYARNIDHITVNREQYSEESIPDHYDKVDENGRRYYLKPLRAMGSEETREARPNLHYPILAPDGTEVYPKLQSGAEGRWRWGRRKLLREVSRIEWSRSDSGWTPYFRIYADQHSGRPPETIFLSKEVGSNRNSVGELKQIFEQGKFFETPKPVGLIKKILSISVGFSDIVLDFFSGSGTTAQAVLELNREDGGNRRFILVQLPEPTGNPELPTIAEIGKERIRRVVARMKSAGTEGNTPAQPELPRETPEDLGFRVYKLAASHFEDWVGVEEKEAESYTRQMDLFRDPLKDGWTPEGVLTELGIKRGLGLSLQIDPQPGAEALYRVHDPETGLAFYTSLASRLTLADLAGLELTSEDTFICRDAALDDETAANLALQCRLETI